ncbi:hypothetical protein THOM_2238, partial [Trachipleistophora hominis]
VGVKHMSLTRHVIFVLVSIKPRYIPVSQVSKFMTFYKYVCERISEYEGMVLTEDMLFSYFLLPSTSCASILRWTCTASLRARSILRCRS